jgi:hypothetical protein
MLFFVASLSLIALGFGAWFAVKANTSPKHADIVESAAGILIVGSLALIGAGLQITLHASLN